MKEIIKNRKLVKMSLNKEAMFKPQKVGELGSGQSDDSAFRVKDRKKSLWNLPLQLRLGICQGCL